MQAIGCLAFAALGLFQIWAAWDGGVYFIGPIWTIVLFVTAMMMRFTLPITVLGFLGPIYVWGWAWYWSALLNFPMLALVVPGMIGNLIEAGRRMFRR